MKEYYVYQHSIKSTGQIFYIGIGNKNRPYTTQGRNKKWIEITQRHEYKVKILHTYKTVERARLKEIELIKKYGRIDKGTGILANKTDGGEWMHGCVYNHSQERGDKISSSLRKFYKDGYSYELMKNARNTPEHKAKMSAAITKWHAERKLSKTLPPSVSYDQEPAL
jgi:hypothetical protein